MATVGNLLGAFKKEYGAGTVTMGGELLVNPDRIPTGVFEFDLATAGGFPRGCVSIVFGPESSSKTNLTLKAIASHQKKFPGLICVFIDVEHSLDLTWAQTLGVDVEKLVVLHPDFAEQCADMIAGLLESDDCGLIVLDSVAAVCTIAEAKQSAEKALFGGAGAVMGRLAHTSGLAMRRAAKEGRQPTLIYISQTRTKMGLVFGNPETFSGGSAIKFQSQMTVRLAGKNVMIEKVSKTMPVIKETSFTLTKWKVKVNAANGIFRLVTLPHGGFQPGELNDVGTLLGCLKSFGLATKVKGGWAIEGVDDIFPKNEACLNALRDSKAWANDLRQKVIELATKHGLDLNDEEEE